MTGPYLHLLGGFDFAGAAVPAISRKARAMVAYLALQSGHSQSRGSRSENNDLLG